MSRSSSIRCSTLPGNVGFRVDVLVPIHDGQRGAVETERDGREPAVARRGEFARALHRDRAGTRDGQDLPLVGHDVEARVIVEGEGLLAAEIGGHLGEALTREGLVGDGRRGGGDERGRAERQRAARAWKDDFVIGMVTSW